MNSVQASFMNTMANLIKALMKAQGFDSVSDDEVNYIVDVYGAVTAEQEFPASDELIKALHLMYERGVGVDDAVVQLDYFQGAMRVTNSGDDQFIITYPEHAEMYSRLKETLAQDGKGGVKPDQPLAFDDASWNVYNTNGTYKIVIVRGDPKSGTAPFIKLSKQQLLGMI